MNKTYPETVWEYSKQTEVERILFVARMIQSYFYQIKNFLVLPRLASKGIHSIYFPNLNIVHHQNFWESLKNKRGKRSEVSEQITQQLYSELPDQKPPTAIRNDWEKIAPQFWQVLQDISPEIFKSVNKLVIRQTAYGARGSSLHMHGDQKGTITIYVRFDANVSSIVAAIFLELLDNNSRSGNLAGYTWEEKLAVGDFLIRHTQLNNLFPQHRSALLETRAPIDNDTKLESKRYLTSLGFPPKQLFDINNDNRVTLNQKEIFLRPTENHVLALLIEKRNQVVSTDHIAERLWAAESTKNYSLYAISKVVERLRKQVQAIGIHPAIIETKRGQGFVLND